MLPFKFYFLSFLALSGSQLATAAVDGLYGTDCMALGKMSAVNDLYFDQGHFEMVQTVFRDGNCEDLAYDLSLMGSYTLDQESGQLIDFVFASARLSALDQNLAELFRSDRLCGLESWQAQEPLEVAGLVCGEQKIPAAGSQAFDRIEESLDGLRLGLPSPAFDGRSPDRRPQEWAPILYQRR